MTTLEDLLKAEIGGLVIRVAALTIENQHLKDQLAQLSGVATAHVDTPTGDKQ